MTADERMLAAGAGTADDTTALAIGMIELNADDCTPPTEATVLIREGKALLKICTELAMLPGTTVATDAA